MIPARVNGSLLQRAWRACIPRRCNDPIREAWFDAIGRYAAVGIREFVFFYMPRIDAWQEQSITSEELLEALVEEMIPAARRFAAPSVST